MVYVTGTVVFAQSVPILPGALLSRLCPVTFSGLRDVGGKWLVLFLDQIMEKLGLDLRYFSLTIVNPEAS